MKIVLIFLILILTDASAQDRDSISDSHFHRYGFKGYVFWKLNLSAGTQIINHSEKAFSNAGFRQPSDKLLNINLGIELSGNDFEIRTMNVNETRTDSSNLDYWFTHFMFHISPIYGFACNRKLNYRIYGGFSLTTLDLRGKINSKKYIFGRHYYLVDFGFQTDYMLFENKSTSSQGKYIGLRIGYLAEIGKSKLDKMKGKSVSVPALNSSGPYMNIAYGLAGWGP